MLRPSSANQPRKPRLLGQMGLAFNIVMNSLSRFAASCSAVDASDVEIERRCGITSMHGLSLALNIRASAYRMLVT